MNQDKKYKNISYRTVAGYLAGMVGGLICGLCGCTQAKEFEAAGTAMGTIIHQKIYGTQDITSEIEDEIVRLETQLLSRREEASEISRINEYAGQAEGLILSEELSDILTEIWGISKESGGALDITVGPVVTLWNIDTYALMDEGFTVPTEQELTEALRLTGYDKVCIQQDKLFLPEGMSLDLGAVGKGIACDRICKILEASPEVTGAVISVGGSVVTYGEKPDGTSWIVGIQNPRVTDGTGNYVGKLKLSGNWFVSTSGDYERYVEKDGIRYHHIMNPMTGYPAKSDVVSVTILSKEGILSDALSTACFVLGKEEGFALAKRYGAEILTVDENGKIDMSEGMKQYFQP